MGTKRHGNRLVSDLTKTILFVIKRGASSLEEVIDLLGSGYQDKKVRSRVYSLKRNGFLDVDADRLLEITEKGLFALENLKLRTIKTPKVWDKKWRLVIYDIPESKRAARDKIRILLKELGFEQLQISSWVHPLPCLDQFHYIRSAYGIQSHMYLFEIEDSAEFVNLRKVFAKRYPKIISD